MPHVRKLRVATADDVSSLAIVRAELSVAVGQVPRADLQELERDAVVVELAIDPAADLPRLPSDLRREVSRTCRDIEVLSSWDEMEPPTAIPPAPPGRVLWDSEIVTVPVALRAVLDGVPSAEWVDSERSWTLGVPCVADGDRRAVAVTSQRGYSRRFSPSPAWRTGVSCVPA